MLPRPSWRGYLRLSLVTCPVAMLPATSEAEKVRFHTLNRATGCIARGYQYIGITDHSKTAHYAGGLTVEEIEQQHAEIDRLNGSFGGRFRIFKGIESDILPE